MQIEFLHNVQISSVIEIKCRCFDPNNMFVVVGLCVFKTHRGKSINISCKDFYGIFSGVEKSESVHAAMRTPVQTAFGKYRISLRNEGQRAVRQSARRS